MQPILAAATHTTAVITSTDIRAAMNKTTSFKAAAFATAMFTFAFSCQIFSLVVRNPRHPLFSDVQSDLSVFLLLLCAAMAVRNFALALGKRRQSQAAG